MSGHAGTGGDPLERITGPLPRVRETPLPQTPPPDQAEQAVTKLNEAAHLIEREEGQGKSERKARFPSRASRLTPIVNIAADIRSESTPLPDTWGKPGGEATPNPDGNSPIRAASGSGLPDYWPWLDTDSEEQESDGCANRPDPFIARHIPNGAEYAALEEEDMRRAMADGMPTAILPNPTTRRHVSRRRIAFRALAIVALLAMAVDGALLFVAFSHSHPKDGTAAGLLPTLTLSSQSAQVGSTVTLQLEHFSDSASVSLTHDVQEPILIKGSPTIPTDATGNATVPVVIDQSWSLGFHLIVAEDVPTRYSASATLQITGAGPAPPPHLLLDTRPLDLGTDVVGANTIRTFTLANSGGGSITWSASSQQPWLLVSPGQGMFSQSQPISIAAQRVGLEPGDYKGAITISSNVGTPEHIAVDMAVGALPANPGPVIALAPALLSFTATDGGPDPAAQSLTISDPGSLPLHWSFASAQGAACNWLGASPPTGTVDAGASGSIEVTAHHSQCLPGAYIGALKFSAAGGAFDGVQTVNVSLTVQPRCGVVSNLGYLAFTAVQGQNTQANQSLNLSATAGCAGAPINWSATAGAPWLKITPASGLLQGTASAIVSVSVDTAYLPPSPKPYYGELSFVAEQSTFTVVVQLTLQATPPATAPLMSASPLNLNYLYTQGQTSLTGQVVAIVNNGESALNWSASPQQPAYSWLRVLPGSGSVAPGQAGQVTVNVSTAQLTPGNYVGQVILSGKDTRGNTAAGSPVAITVSLVVQPPCTLSPPSASALSFSALQGAPSNPAAQTVLLTGTGGCAWPLTWTSSVAPAASWLALSASGGTLKGSGQSSSIAVSTNIAGLHAGTYTTKVTLAASDAGGTAAQGSPQSFTVTLTVLPPCVLSPPSASALSFSAAQGASSNPAAQTVLLTGTGGCAWPLTWTSSVAPAASWLALSASGGTLKGSGQSSSIAVSTNIAGLHAGTYRTKVTIAASDAGGAAAQGSPQSFTVTLTVLPPCVLSPPSPASLSFTVLQGQTSAAAQKVTFGETGTCAFPVTWTASAGSLAWLVLAPTTGTDSGSGSAFSVNVTPASLAPGLYQGQITIAATDSTGAALGSQSLKVSLTVTATYAVSGTVVACSGPAPACPSPQPLPGATVTLMNGTATVATTTADASGNYSFSGIAAGAYTITASGSDASNTHYAGSAPLTVAGNTTNFPIQAFPV